MADPVPAPTPARLEGLRELETELEAIRQRLATPGPREGRDEVRRRIVALFRRTDAALDELTSLKEQIRVLVDQYKSVRDGDRAATPPGPQATPAESAIREDHIGASTYIEKGWSLIAVGDHVGAIEALTHATRLAPNDLQGHALLGWAQMLNAEYDAALGTFSLVLGREPNNALARVNVGYICLKKRIYGEAIEHLSRVLRLEADRKATLYAHYYLGLVYFERGMHGDAEGFLRKAVALGPNLIEAYYDLGRSLWHGGKPEEARTVWQAGIAANRHAPWAARCQEMLDLIASGGAVPGPPAE